MKRWLGDVNAKVSSSEAGCEGAFIKLVCKCIGVSDINARVCCSGAQCEGAYGKGSAQVP